jgi:hypothetical protein
MAGDLTQVLISKVNDLTTIVNSIIEKAKYTEDLTDATTPLGATDKVRVSQGGVSKKVEVSEFGGTATWGSILGTITSQTDLIALFSVKNVVRFTATAGQTVYNLPGAIVDDGLWTVQVGSELWNSTTGITSFTDGNISIAFGTGVITFNYALDLGTQVIIKYN